MFLIVLLANLLTASITADLVVTNARIWTGDSQTAEVEAIAIWNDRVLMMGSNDEIKSVIGKQTRVIDARNRRVLPGFSDSHVHFLGGGLQLARVELKDAENEAEFGRRLQEFDRTLPRDRWILGGNWDHDRTFQGKLPTAEIVDKYVKNRPVFIQRYDGHMALANSAALKLAGITAKTAEVPGGVVYRLSDGITPSGVLKDNAMGLVDRLIPEPSDDEIAEAIRAAMKMAAESGVTSVQDMEGSSAVTRRKYIRVLQRLAKSGQLTCRVNVHWPISEQKELVDVGSEANFGNDFVRIGGVKGFMDGSLGSSTAKMFEPYVGDLKNRGVYVTEPQFMKALIRSADRAGLLVAVHAIGDEANSVLLDLFAETARENGSRKSRFRIEHVQHLRAIDYPRFKQGDVIASMQPYHVADDGRWAEGRIGFERCRSSYAFRSLLDAGATLAFGSDWPVAPLAPLPGVAAAVTRRTLDGKHPMGWFPEQKITVQEAIKAYTYGSAYASFQEAERGSLAVGKWADLVVLDTDILDPAQIDRIEKAQVITTIVAGKVVFERK